MSSPACIKNATSIGLFTLMHSEQDQYSTVQERVQPTYDFSIVISASGVVDSLRLEPRVVIRGHIEPISTL